MKKPTMQGPALSQRSTSNLADPFTKSKARRRIRADKERLKRLRLFVAPSIIPGIEYPITEREKQIIQLTWRHAILKLKDTGGLF